MTSLIPLTRAEAVTLAEGNKAGAEDYNYNRPRRFTLEDPDYVDIPVLFIRGYLAGYRMASRGRRPALTALRINPSPISKT